MKSGFAAVNQEKEENGCSFCCSIDNDIYIYIRIQNYGLKPSVIWVYGLIWTST